MKKKLLDIFKDRAVTTITPEAVHRYHWYLDEENVPIGLPLDISQAERDLIGLNYTAIHLKNQKDINQLAWLHFLTSTDFSFDPPTTDEKKLTFIFLTHDFDDETQHEFAQLLHGFDETIVPFFLDDTYGVLLDFGKNRDEEEFQDFLLATTEDFSSSLVFYETTPYDITKWLPSKYKAEFDLFKTLRGHRGNVLRHKDLFLNYLVSSDVIGTHPIFGDWFKEILLVDAELLAVVKCYLENGFNVTTGSKMMHMHRNTFANKLDRFKELTGLDVKDFDQAVIAHLLMRLRKDV